MSGSGLSGLPPRRPVATALTYLPGMTRARAKALLEQAHIDPDLRTEALDDVQVEVLRRLLREARITEDEAAAAAATDGPWLQGAGQAYAPWLRRVRAMIQRYIVALRPWEGGAGAGAGAAAADDPLGAATSLDAACMRCLRGEALEPERAAFVARMEQQLAVRYDDIVARSDGGRRFDELRVLFGLSDLQADLLWLLLAPDLVPEFLWLYRALWRDTRATRWAEDFLRHAVDPFAIRDADVLAALGPGSALRRYGLIHTTPDQDGQATAWAAARFVTAYLSGRPVGLADLPGALWHQPPTDASGGQIRELPVRREVRDALRRGYAGRRRFVVLGPARGGALRIARESLHAFGEGLLEVRLDALLDAGGVRAVGHVLGRARLARAGVFFTGVEKMDHGPHGAERLDALVRLLQPETTTMFFHSEQRQSGADHALSPRVHLRMLRELGGVELPTRAPDIDERREAWRERLLAEPTAADQRSGGQQATRQTGPVATAPRVAERDAAPIIESVGVYRFGIDEIDLAVSLARATAANARRDTLRQADIERACRAVASARLSGLATRVNVHGSWDTTVLPDETREVLEEMVQYGRHAARVLDERGYGRNIGYGRALTCLFSGPSGTGKTRCAGLAARDLGLELFRVDLASVVSKYIGETEERLSQLFDASEEAGIALLFDEADALFAKRTDVQSSVDRYANLEVNYLLQRLEDFEGLVILTTNHPDSIDAAFMRRIRFKAHFPAPDEPERARLWRVMVPPDAPQDPDITWAHLAEDYELTGGQIQNAVIRAAVWAEEAGAPLSQPLLERAAEREYKDMGRVVRVYSDDEQDDPGGTTP